MEQEVRLRDQPTMYDSVGGMPFFERLVDGFYRRVAADRVLLVLYPDPVDLAPARHRLTLFLASTGAAPPPTPSSGATQGCACATTRS